MDLYPTARGDGPEVIKRLKLRAYHQVFEMTAGSGYLTFQIASRVPRGLVHAYDVSQTMLSLSLAKAGQLGTKNVKHLLDPEGDLTLTKGEAAIPDASMHRVVCLGGFHHLEKSVDFMRATGRILKRGGLAVFADFAGNSTVSEYFDEVIHYQTPTGHSGLFLYESQMENLGRFGGLQTISIERHDTPFIFDTEKDVGIFFKLVHALEQPEEEVLEEIRAYMGIKKVDGKCHVPVPYIYAVYRKP
jgi:SAM-dependent methyltransferase